jgi:hypothetical protein
MRCVRCARCGAEMASGRDELLRVAVVCVRAPGREGLWDQSPPFPMVWLCPACGQLVGSVLGGATPRAAAGFGSVAAGQGPGAVV